MLTFKTISTSPFPYCRPITAVARNAHDRPAHAGGLRLGISATKRAAAQALVDKAHQVCRYFDATRGNIDVTITVL